MRSLTAISRAVNALTAAVPNILTLERDLAVALSTVRRLIGENDELRRRNGQLRRIVMQLQQELTDAKRT